MGTSLKITFILFFFASFLFGDECLEYPVHIPVLQKYESFSTTRNRVGSKEITAYSHEKLSYKVEVLGEAKTKGKRSLSIGFELVDYETEIDSEGKKIAYSAKKFANNFTFLELNSLLGKRIKLNLADLNSGFEPVIESPETEMIKSHQKELNHLIFAKLREQFYLFDTPLSKGAKIEIPLEINDTIPLKSLLVYEIKSVKGEKIKADIILKIKKQKVQGHLNENEEEKSTLTMSGEFSGQASWEKKNPLFFTLEMEGVYSTVFNKGSVGNHLDMDIRIAHTSLAPL